MSDRPQSHDSVTVVVVDDTRSIRAMIRTLLGSDPGIRVVGEAGDPYEARELIRRLNPDVITLDVEMPRMDGLSFLEKLMRLRPTPVVMVSTRTTENSGAAIRALALGAIECVDIAALGGDRKARVDLAATVRMAAKSRPRLPGRPLGRPAQRAKRPTAPFAWNGCAVVIGSSTGGVDALMTVLADYPADGPPTVIAQHMPASFLKSFTRRLDDHCLARVVPAGDGMILERGLVCVAPGGDTHTVLAPGLSQRLAHVPHDGTEPYVPSVGLLFSSAERFGAGMIGVLLTGMGRDGADALLRMRRAGAHTIVQSGETAVVDGMPRAAREAGAAAEVAGLQDIGGRILAAASRPGRHG